DFEDGVDVIQMSGVTYADLTITQNGATSEIEVGGHVIEVYGVDASDLTQDDFLFA
ncbi:MAG TPA: alkaline metalloproteinase, partial [Oceanicaulis sp.]|nr:alkaline metalloproteinase [Oceanicaulis sp.]